MRQLQYKKQRETSQKRKTKRSKNYQLHYSVIQTTPKWT